MRLLAGLKQKIDTQIAQRVPVQNKQASVGRRRLYILPTRFGFGFAFTTLLMLLGAMNYSNSMAYALCFLLASIGLVCMQHTHNNLTNLVLRVNAPAKAFAGQTAKLEILIDNPSSIMRRAITVGLNRNSLSSATQDVQAQSSRTITIETPTQQRGWQPLGVVRLHTTFPLGIFYAWTLVNLGDAGVIVFPQPAAKGVPPFSTSGTGGDRIGTQKGNEEFAGLRNYRPGDSMQYVHWKSLARGNTMMVKEFEDYAARTEWLEWEATANSDVEARLSQLARWIIDAELAGHRYGLRIPGKSIEPNNGPYHETACLTALALFNTEGTPR